VTFLATGLAAQVRPPFEIHARVKKAKELLTSGKSSIIEIAHSLGFADQSHLTRHIKNIFGITPEGLQQR
jgi:AraC family transcriptional regulator